MTMVWNNRDNRFDPNGGNGRESFQEHNERMRGFRRSHASNVEMRAAIQKTPLRDIAHVMTERKGARNISGRINWPAIFPTYQVTPRKFSPN